MKQTKAPLTVWGHCVAWIFIGCCFAEAAFLIIQIALTLLFSQTSYSLESLLDPDNPLYALPPYFYVVGAVFAAGVLFGAWRQYNKAGYYVGCGLVVSLVYMLTLWLNAAAPTWREFVINLVAATVSGFTYWAVTVRRYKK